MIRGPLQVPAALAGLTGLGYRTLSVHQKPGGIDVRTVQSVIAVLGGLLLAACAPQKMTYPTTMDMTTWSVVGVDPKTGDVGVAVASCVQSFGDAVAALVPGKGAAATQAGFDIKNRNKVFEALKEGLTAEEVIARVTNPEWDKDTDRRQYGVLTMHNGFVRAAGFTTPVRQGTITGDDGITRYAGWMADASRGVSAQGNTLASHEVVQGPLNAYRWDDPAGFNRLSDRLMRAIEAGSIAGGDVRCNNGSTRQTTSMAAILVARGGDPPYAAENIGMTDAGTNKAPWLNLSVKAERGADNPLLELRRQYDRWRKTQPK
jgi:uncharacterized Ntn-hydrolase superfamily protein